MNVTNQNQSLVNNELGHFISLKILNMYMYTHAFSISDDNDLVHDVLQDANVTLLTQEECREFHIDIGFPDIPPDIDICAGGSGTSMCIVSRYWFPRHST